MKKILITAMMIAACLFVVRGEKTEAATTVQPIYRLYNKSTKEHLFTPSANEYKVLPAYGWTQEGVAWYAPKSGKGVYRLYNPRTKDHHYTVSTNEAKVLTTKYGWVYDNNKKPLFCSGGTKKIYRLYNKRLKTGSHHFTMSANEYKVLPRYGWKQEGSCFNAVDHAHNWKDTYKTVTEYKTETKTEYKNVTENITVVKCPICGKDWTSEGTSTGSAWNSDVKNKTELLKQHPLPADAKAGTRSYSACFEYHQTTGELFREEEEVYTPDLGWLPIDHWRYYNSAGKKVDYELTKTSEKLSYMENVTTSYKVPYQKQVKTGTVCTDCGMAK